MKNPSSALITRSNKGTRVAGARLPFGTPIAVPGAVGQQIGSSLPLQEAVSA